MLLVRKGEDRCRLESPIKNIASFKSYSNITEICAEFAVPLGQCVAAEMRALPWSLAQMLSERLKGIDFISGDKILYEARFIKTSYELSLLHEVNRLHSKALLELYDGNFNAKSEVILENSEGKLRLGMNEREIAHATWRNFFANNHGGMLRMNDFTKETFLGKIAIGKNALCPSPYTKGMGLMGEHPAAPFMGYAGNVWNKDQILLMDTGFIFKGYHSAAMQTYFAGLHIPDLVHRAHECCFEILKNIEKNVDNNWSSTWSVALNIAEKYGFSEGFMGLNENKSHVIAQSLGLALDGRAVFAKDLIEQVAEIKASSVFSVNPVIALPNYGMVGIRHSFEITEDMKIVPFAGLEQKKNILCVN